MIRLLIFLTLIPLTVFAREVGGDSPYIVRVWQSSDGLPGNVVRSVGQTQDGYLWISTAEGVVRFDGLQFETVPVAEEPHGRPISYFRIFTPADGSLWVSTHRDGLFKLNDGRLVPVVSTILDQGKQRNLGHVTSLFTNRGATYFFWDYRYCRLENGVAESVSDPDADLKAAFAAQERENQTRGRGHESVKPERLIDRRGGAWSVEDNRLAYHAPGSNGSTGAAVIFEKSSAILDMLEDREGNLWLASSVEGLIRVQHRKVSPLLVQGKPYQGAIYTALQDRNQGWWIANRNGQVDRIRNGVVSSHRLVTGNQTRSVACIFEDSGGRVWFGTGDQSVMRWDEAGQKFVAGFPKHPELSKIKAIAEDSKQRLWFAGTRNLIRIDGEHIENFRDAPLLQNATFTALAFNARGDLLVGTADGRLISYDGSDFELLGVFTGHARNWVSSIVPIGSDEIWVATIGAGLFLRKNGTWHRFGPDEGLPDARVTGLALAGGDFFWMGSLGGIVQVSRSELLRSLGTRNHLPRWKQFGRSDGLPTRECVGGVQPGVIRDNAGSLWFPTLAGLAGVEPNEPPAASPPPLLQLRSIEINGVSAPSLKNPISAGPGRVRLGFEYIGIDLSAPEKVTYRVQLRGLDERPQSVGSDRKVSYQSVSPGRYSLEVVAINGDGIPSARVLTMPITVRPYFWQTTWFMGLATAASLLAALAIGWIVARRRMKQKLQEIRVKSALEAERSRISRDLHDDLGASLTELSILSELIAEQEEVKESRDDIGNLSLKAKMAVGSLDEIVWATNPSQDSLKSLVEYLAFFAEDYLKTVKVPLRVELPDHLPEVTIGPRRRHHILLASREALNNAVKHACPERIDMKVMVANGSLVVEIRDDGRGFDLETANSGNGLTNLRRRMNDCGGDCRIESSRGCGTTVTLSLPLET